MVTAVAKRILAVPLARAAAAVEVVARKGTSFKLNASHTSQTVF